MIDDPAPAAREAVIALGIWITVAVLVLVAIAMVNNTWRIWDTAAFCGSYADFFEPPVPTVCLSFRTYFRLQLTHPPHIIPAVLLGGIAAMSYLFRRKLLGDS